MSRYKCPCGYVSRKAEERDLHAKICCKAHSLHRPGSAATWWVYHLTDEGKTVYITAIPLPLKRAQGHQRAAQRYCRGRHVIQLTEVPPNEKS